MRFGPLLRVLGENAKRARLAARRTQEDVAHEAGLTVRAYAGIERGQTRNPSLGSVHAIATTLGVEVTELLAPQPGASKPQELRRGRKPSKAVPKARAV